MSPRVWSLRVRRRHVRVRILSGCDSSIEAQIYIEGGGRGESFGYMTGVGTRTENETFMNASLLNTVFSLCTPNQSVLRY